MTKLLQIYSQSIAQLGRLDAHLPTLARAIFAAVLLGYFWTSGLTKFDGPFTLSDGAYAQIFPKAFEAVGYDSGQLGLHHTLIALAGGWAELVLPTLIVLGLMTRLAALGMVGFVIVQSLTDVFGHMVDAATIGTWFDAPSDALILDQRALWVMLLLTLVIKGAGPISVDRFLRQ
jgi:putative oxidoreductase